MKKFRLISLILALILALVFSAAALGDDVDFGGGDTGGDWSYDGGDYDDGDYDDDSYGGDFDSGGFGGGGTYFDSGGSGGGGMLVPIGGGSIVLIVIVAVIFMLVMQRQGGLRMGAPTRGTTRRIDQASLQALMKQDPNFSAADIEAKVKNWVLQFESAWCNGDMSPCRPFITDGLFNTYQMQLDMMKKNGEASRTEDLAVMACNVEKWVQDGDKEYLDVWMQQKKRTYKVAINNPQTVLKGDKQTTYILEYRWQLMRSAGSLSDDAGIRVMECPNCGAQTSVNQSGKCEYCGTTLKAESFDWTLNKVDKLAQTSHK